MLPWPRLNELRTLRQGRNPRGLRILNHGGHMTIYRPKLLTVPMADGLTWGSNHGCLLQEKSDGQHRFKVAAPRATTLQDVENCPGAGPPFQDAKNCLFNTEQMPDGEIV